MSTNSTFQHLQQSIRTHSFRVQYHSGTVLTETLPKRHLWAASRTVCHSPLVYSPCWRVPPREFANYLPDADPDMNEYILLTYKVLQRSAARYLGPLVRVADQPGRWTLRSASSSSLLVPPVKLSTVGSRVWVFTVTVWNTLPEATTSTLSLTIFCQRLKSWLFRQSYPDLIIWPDT